MEPATNLTLEGLTARIADSSKTISHCFNAQGFRPLSFTADGPTSFPVPPSFALVQAARLALIEATDLLRRLVIGPQEYTHWIATAHHDTSAFRTLLRLGVFEAVPLHDSISYTDLARNLSTDAPRLRRILRYAQTTGLFHETSPEYVAHSSISATLVRDTNHKAMMIHNLEDAYPATCAQADNVIKHPVDQGEANQAGFNEAFATDKPFFEWLQEESQTDRKNNFAKTMNGLSMPGGMLDGAILVNQFDWGSLGEGTVVDVGGGKGHISAILAKAYPNLNFVVQDLDSVVQLGKDSIPTNLLPRFELMPHNFLDPQPDLRGRVKGSITYFMRSILHDWSHKYCVRILKNIVGVLEEGGRILINDQVLPPKGAVNNYLDKLGHLMDMQMMTLLNAQERSREDFENLLRDTDPRLKLVEIHSAPPSPLAIIEVKLGDKGGKA